MRAYPCSRCDLTFEDPDERARHLSLDHDPVKPTPDDTDTDATIDGTDDNTPRATGVPIWDDDDTDDTDPVTTFSFDTVAGILRDAGVPNVTVEQTGGGTATLYGGPMREERDDYGNVFTRYAVALGPGVFDGPGWTNGYGYIEEASFGPDDDGEGDYVSVEDIAVGPNQTVEEAVAAAVLAFLGPEGIDREGQERKRELERRIGEASQAAQDAFWAVVADRFPEAQFGDFDPLSYHAWDSACERAVKTWVSINVEGE